MSLSSIVHEVAADLLPSRPTLDDLVDEALKRAPDEVAVESDRLIRRALARQFKDQLRSAHDTDDEYAENQLSLPGFEHLPANLVICVPEGNYFVPTHLAVLDELDTAIEERRQHMHRVEVVLDELLALRAICSPAMEADPAGVTVADALMAVPATKAAQ